MSAVPSQPKEPDSPSGGHTARGRVERRGIVTGRASRLLLARSEAAGECRGVFVLRTTARPDGAYADDHVRDVLIAAAGDRGGHTATRGSNCFGAEQRAGCNARRRKTRRGAGSAPS